jgi:hypothetical protein
MNLASGSDTVAARPPRLAGATRRVGKGIGGAILVTRSIEYLIEIMSQELEPTHLPSIENTRFREVFEVLVIGEDLNR